jgi:hypothetical protein
MVAHLCKCENQISSKLITFLKPNRDNPHSDICIPVTKLFKSLDACLNEESLRHRRGHRSETDIRKEEKEHQIDDCLTSAMKAFVARWFPLIPHRNYDVVGQDEALIRESWRMARKAMLRVINHASYRSILALYLFSQTPIPVGIPEEEELMGISGLVCIHTALLQIQRLRERQKTCQYFGSQVSAWIDAIVRSVPTPGLTETHLDFETRAFWAAVIWDTSSSLTSNFRSSLTSGLKGACLEPVWRLARTFLVGSLHSRTDQLRTKTLEVSDEVASQILSAASVCQLYLWKTATSLKEAFREGVEEESVLSSWGAVLDAIDIFQSSIRPLLNACERQLHFLNQLNRFSWYQFSLQYHLGILIIVDALEAAGRSDLLADFAETRCDAEHESFNTLKLGIESKFTIHELGYIPTTVSRSDRLDHSITASFISIDPYPHHVIDSVILMGNFIIDKYCKGKMTDETYSYLSSTLLTSLQQLPQSSKSVQASQKTLQQSFERAKFVNIR